MGADRPFPLLAYDLTLEGIEKTGEPDPVRSIADALRLNPAAETQQVPVAGDTASLPANELFQQARRLIQGRTEAGITTVRGLLDGALVLDQANAPALTASAQAMLLLAETSNTYGGIPPGQAIAEAREAEEEPSAEEPDEEARRLSPAYARPPELDASSRKRSTPRPISEILAALHLPDDVKVRLVGEATTKE